MTGRPSNEPAMSRVAAADRTARRRYRHGRRVAGGIAGAALGVVLLIWTLLPVYNMVLISLDDEGTSSLAASGRRIRRSRAFV